MVGRMLFRKRSLLLPKTLVNALSKFIMTLRVQPLRLCLLCTLKRGFQTQFEIVRERGVANQARVIGKSEELQSTLRARTSVVPKFVAFLYLGQNLIRLTSFCGHKHIAIAQVEKHIPSTLHLIRPREHPPAPVHTPTPSLFQRPTPT